MAIVETVNSDWVGITGKTLSIQSKLNSKMLETIVDVVVGCADTYPMCQGGIVTDLSACGRLATILYADIFNVSNSLQGQYNPAACCAAATGTVVFSDELPGASAVALAEIAGCSAAIQCMTFRVHVIGF